MMTRYLGIGAIAVLLGIGGFGVDAVSAQGYPDVERQHQQHEQNVELQQQRKAQHRAQQREQRVRQQEKMQRHGEKVRRKNELETEGARQPPLPI